jgi:hypothetical protein
MCRNNAFFPVAILRSQVLPAQLVEEEDCLVFRRSENLVIMPEDPLRLTKIFAAAS